VVAVQFPKGDWFIPRIMYDSVILPDNTMFVMFDTDNIVACYEESVNTDTNWFGMDVASVDGSIEEEELIKHLICLAC